MSHIYRLTDDVIKMSLGDNNVTKVYKGLDQIRPAYVPPPQYHVVTPFSWGIPSWWSGGWVSGGGWWIYSPWGDWYVTYSQDWWMPSLRNAYKVVINVVFALSSEQDALYVSLRTGTTINYRWRVNTDWTWDLGVWQYLYGWWDPINWDGEFGTTDKTITWELWLVDGEREWQTITKRAHTTVLPYWIWTSLSDTQIDAIKWSDNLHIELIGGVVVKSIDMYIYNDVPSPSIWPWIYWNESLWLISLSSDWQNWFTIADKNLWATTVCRYSTSLPSASEFGTVFQWWNDYGFNYRWTWLVTASWQVDLSWYDETHHYNSSTFAIDNVDNRWHWATDCDDVTTVRWTKWPCPDWYHLPSSSDMTALNTILTDLRWSTVISWTGKHNMVFCVGKYLFWPRCCYYIDSSGIPHTYSSVPALCWGQSENGCSFRGLGWWGSNWYWATTATDMYGRAHPIRPFKDVPSIPDGTWERLFEKTTPTLELVSISKNPIDTWERCEIIWNTTNISYWNMWTSSVQILDTYSLSVDWSGRLIWTREGISAWTANAGVVVSNWVGSANDTQAITVQWWYAPWTNIYFRYWLPSWWVSNTTTDSEWLISWNQLYAYTPLQETDLTWKSIRLVMAHKQVRHDWSFLSHCIFKDTTAAYNYMPYWIWRWIQWYPGAWYKGAWELCYERGSDNDRIAFFDSWTSGTPYASCSAGNFISIIDFNFDTWEWGLLEYTGDYQTMIYNLDWFVTTAELNEIRQNFSSWPIYWWFKFNWPETWNRVVSWQLNIVSNS